MKIAERQKLTDQKLFDQITKQTFQHVEIILDPGCSIFGQLPHKPFTKTVRVMFDYDVNAWVRIEA